MSDNAHPDPASATGQERITLLADPVRYLQAGLTPDEPQQGERIDDRLDGPQRSLSAQEIEQHTRRLLEVCASQGVEAVIGEVATSRELLLSLADACHQAGLIEAAQYLFYLDQPYD
jgi:hypothetical protein